MLQKVHYHSCTKEDQPSCWNDYWHMALISVVMKCSKRLVKDFICSSQPRLDHLYFCHCLNRSTNNDISYVLCSGFSHIDKEKLRYVPLLIINYSWAFNTIVPSRLSKDLRLNSMLCSWVLKLMTHKNQVVINGHTLSTSSRGVQSGEPSEDEFVYFLYQRAVWHFDALFFTCLEELVFCLSISTFVTF